MHDALCPGGYFVVETPQRDWVVQHLKTAERFGEGERYTVITRRFETADNTVTEIFGVVSHRSTQTYVLRYRLYSQAELVGLLEQASFTLLAAYGDYEGNPLDADSAIMLLFGRK